MRTTVIVAVWGWLVMCSAEAQAAERCSLQAAPAMSLEDSLELLAPISNRALGSLATTTGVGLPAGASFETMMIDGLTKFVIKRARQEAIAFVLDLVHDKICANAKALFPLTCAQFSAADETGTAVLPGRAFQDALIADLRAIPWNVAGQIDSVIPALPAAERSAAKNVVTLLRAVDDLACGLERRQSPLLLLAAAIQRHRADLRLAPESAAALQVAAALLSRVSGDAVAGWFDNPERFAAVMRSTLRGGVISVLSATFKLANDEVRQDLPASALLIREAFDIVVLSLPALREAGATAEAKALVRARLTDLKARAASLAGGASTEIRAVVASFTDIVDHVLGLIEDPISAPTHLSALVAAAQNAGPRLVALESVAKSLTGLGSEWANLEGLALKLQSIVFGVANDKWKDHLDKLEDAYRTHVEPIVPHALAVYAGIRSYRAASEDPERKAALRQILDAAVGLVEQLAVPAVCGAATECPLGKLTSGGLTTARAFLSGDYNGAIRHLTALVQQVGDLGQSKAFTEIKRFGALFSEIAVAKTGDEIAAAIESAAAPLGSWRLRRKKTTFGLSARVGVAGGYEHIVRSGDLDDNGGTFGVHIPIVLDAWRASKCPVGIGLQLLDLGTVASVGFGSNTEIKPDASFADVLAPGISLSLGLGESPFVFALSASWTPALRATDTEMESQPESHDAWRYMVSLSVDVPIFMW